MVLLKAEDLHVRYTSSRLESAAPYALRAVSFDVQEGEVVGVTGPSGSGKSTLIRAVARLIAMERGRLWLDGRDYTRLSESEMRLIRAALQATFQDALGSFDPRWSVATAIAEPLRWLAGPLPRAELDRRVGAAAELVGLKPGCLGRSARSLSGGQVRRAALARALVIRPRILLLDEPFAGLDVSAQVDLIPDLRQAFAELSLTALLVTHDAAHLLALTGRLLVIENGQIVREEQTKNLPHGQRFGGGSCEHSSG